MLSDAQFQELPLQKQYDVVRDADTLAEAIQHLWFLARGTPEDYHQALFECIMGEVDIFDRQWCEQDIPEEPGLSPAGTIFVGGRPEDWCREHEEIWMMVTKNEVDRDRTLLQHLFQKFRISLKDVLAAVSEIDEVKRIRAEIDAWPKLPDHTAD